MTTTKRTPTRREREAVIDRSASVDFAAAVLKGLVEHNDAAAYFGSTGALLTWIGIAEGRGWIIGVKGPRTVTEAGRKHYDESGLEQLPKIRDRRAYLWNWSCYTASEEPVPPPPPAQSSTPRARAKPARVVRAGKQTPRPRRSA
jgi:hypothetical protein